MILTATAHGREWNLTDKQFLCQNSLGQTGGGALPRIHFDRCINAHQRHPQVKSWALVGGRLQPVYIVILCDFIYKKVFIEWLYQTNIGWLHMQTEGRVE